MTCASGNNPLAVRNCSTDRTTVSPGSPDPTGIAVFRPSSHVWYFHDGPAVQFGTTDDIGVPADYNGDGTSQDTAVFRPSTGLWLFPAGPTSQFGTSGDIPVPGDYTATGRRSSPVFRPSTDRARV